jgi:hypothetical protein
MGLLARPAGRSHLADGPWPVLGWIQLESDCKPRLRRS